MWPRREYDLPIFGADVVAIGADVTFAIADTTPVNDARQLPDTYVDAVRLLRAQFADGMRRAELPDWGEKLFSEEVMSVRPDLPVEADVVGMHVTALCKAHILYSKFAENIKIDAGDASRLAEVDRNHRRCAHRFSCAELRCCVSEGEGGVSVATLHRIYGPRRWVHCTAACDAVVFVVCALVAFRMCMFSRSLSIGHAAL